MGQFNQTDDCIAHYHCTPRSHWHILSLLCITEAIRILMFELHDIIVLEGNSWKGQVKLSGSCAIVLTDQCRSLQEQGKATQLLAQQNPTKLPGLNRPKGQKI